jgi:hypothetical protein
LQGIPFSCILTIQQLIIHDSVQKALNPQKSKEYRIHLIARPDLALGDFFLFGYLKEKLCGASLTMSNDLIFSIWPILSEISEMAPKNVLTNRITRQPWARRKGNEYCTK